MTVRCVFIPGIVLNTGRRDGSLIFLAMFLRRIFSPSDVSRSTSLPSCWMHPIPCAVATTRGYLLGCPRCLLPTGANEVALLRNAQCAVRPAQAGALREGISPGSGVHLPRGLVCSGLPRTYMSLGRLGW